MSGRAADVSDLKRSSSHPVKLTLSRRKDQHVQASNLAQAGHAFFALTHSMTMHVGRAAEMVTPIGDKKTLFPAESPVISSGCAGRGRQEGQLAKEQMEAREAAGSAATRRCVRRPRLQRARVRLCGLVSMYTSRSRRHWAWGAAPSTYTP